MERCLYSRKYSIPIKRLFLSTQPHEPPRAAAWKIENLLQTRPRSRLAALIINVIKPWVATEEAKGYNDYGLTCSEIKRREEGRRV